VDIDLLIAAGRRFVSVTLAAETTLIIALTIPVVLTALTLRPLLTLLCALAAAVAGFTLSLGSPDRVVYGAASWLAEWLIVLFAINAAFRARRERLRSREFADMKAQLLSLSASYENYFLQQLRREHPGSQGAVLGATSIYPLKDHSARKSGEA
jgi:hypothetical protein